MSGLRWQHPFSRKSRRTTGLRDRKPVKHQPMQEPRPPRERARPSWWTYLIMVFFLLVLLITITAMMAEWKLSPIIRSWAEIRAINIATRAINVAVEETMAASISSTEMAILIKDDHGTLQGIQYDMGEINRVSSQATHKVQQTLNNLGDETFPVPLGQLTGLDFLAAWGPGIPIRVIPMGAVTTTPVGSFESAGINQTWHRVFLDIQVTMRVMVPLMSTNIPVQSRVPIVEEVFIGTVPSWYFAPQPGNGSIAPLEDGKPQGVVEFRLTDQTF